MPQNHASPITVGGQVRVAADNKPQSIIDGLRLHLGLVSDPRAMLGVRTDASAPGSSVGGTISDIAVSLPVDLVHDAWDDDWEEVDQHTPEGVTCRALVEQARQLDEYDIGRQAQLLMDQDCFCPIYYRRAGEPVERYLDSPMLRFVYKHTTHFSDGSGRVKRTIKINEDTELPRVVFMTLVPDGTHGFCGEMVNAMFGKGATLQERREDEQGAVSIEVGIKALRFNPNDVPQNRQHLLNERRNWMVFVVKGHPASVLSDTQVIKLLDSGAKIIVMTNSENEIPELEQCGVVVNDVTFWSNTNARQYNTNARLHHVQGSCAQVSKALLNRVLLSGSVCDGLPLEKMAIETEHDDPLSFFLHMIGNEVNLMASELLRDNEGCGFRASLKLCEICKNEENQTREAATQTGAAHRDLQSSLRDLKRQKADVAHGSVPSIIELLFKILKRENRAERMLGVKELSQQLELAEQRLLDTDLQKVREAKEDLRVKGLSDQGARTKMNEAKFELNEKQVSIEVIWRELGFFFEQNAVSMQQAPMLAAQFLLDGGSMELVNGDTASVNTVWVGAVVETVRQLLVTQHGREVRVLVTSSTGVESSGKSTLTNAQTGCDMRTSEGACTRGVNFALVPSSGDWRVKVDYLLCLDTEGLCNPLFKDRRDYHRRNHWLATMAMLAADVCFLVCNNEDHTLVQDVLPFALEAHQGAKAVLETAGFTQRHLFFVYNRIDPVAKEGLKDKHAGLVDKLQKQAAEIPLQPGDEGRAAPIETFSIINQDDFQLLGQLSDIEDYGMQVAALRERMDERLGSQWRPMDLGQWWTMFEALEGAMEHHNFAFSFGTIMAHRTAMDWKNTVQKAEWQVDMAWRVALKHEMAKLVAGANQLTAGVSSPERSCWEIENELKHNPELLAAIDTATAAIDAKLAEPRHLEGARNARESWQESLTTSANFFSELLRVAYSRYMREDEEEVQLQNNFLATLRTCVNTPEKRAELNSGKKQKDVFQDLFQAHLSELEKRYPPVDVADNLWKVWPEEWRTVRNGDVRSARTKAPAPAKQDEVGWFKKLCWMGTRGGGSTKQQLEPWVESMTRVHTVVMEICRSIKQEGNEYSFDSVYAVIDCVKRSGLDAANQAELAQRVYKDLFDALTEAQDRWENVNNLYSKFKNQQDALWRSFQVLCRGLNEEAEATELVLEQLLNESFRNYCASKAIELYAGAARDLRWVYDEQALIAEINRDIFACVCTGDEATGVHKAIALMRDVKGHSDNVQHRLVSAAVDQTPESQLLVRLQELEMCFNSLSKRVSDETKTSKATMTSKRFAELFLQKMPSMLLLDLSPISNLGEIIKPNDFVSNFISEFRKKWKSVLPTYDESVFLPKWADIKPELKKTQGGGPRCFAQCPRCAAPCIHEAGHTGLHDCYHQPAGLSGMKDRDTNEVVAHSCLDSLQKNRLMVFKVGTPEEYARPYSEFEDVYKEWKLPSLIYDKQKDDYANAVFRISFFATYHHHIAEYWGLEKSTASLSDVELRSLMPAVSRLANRK
mmetsp:Transcript_63518/g.132206  ORF Transcript_63518/g.132206 Transcript_63518/m.132206 type:complete len:1526 (-) Transcript_63518:162-4739(-)